MEISLVSFNTLDAMNPDFGNAVMAGMFILPIVLVIAVIVITVRLIRKFGKKK